MTTITICQLKGGTGKTTTAILTAVALTRQGHTVRVLDADPQGSATEWADIAHDTGDPLAFPVDLANARTLRRRTGMDDADYTLIDCPPGNAQHINAAIDAADHIIIPTSPSAIEVDRMWDTLTLSPDKPTEILLTSVRLRTRALDDIRHVLHHEHVPLAPATILHRQAIKALWGTNPHGTLYGYDTLATHITQETTK